MAAKRRPSVDARRPAEASSARKAHSDSAVAGSALNPRERHQDSKIRKSLAYASCVALAFDALAKSAASSSVEVSSAGSAGCSMMTISVQSMMSPSGIGVMGIYKADPSVYIATRQQQYTWGLENGCRNAALGLRSRHDHGGANSGSKG